MVCNHAFYTISEAEVVYYIPYHSGTQTYRLHPERGDKEAIYSSLLLQRWNGPQGSNTNPTHSETYTNNWSLFLGGGSFLSLGTIFLIPRIPGIRGIFVYFG